MIKVLLADDHELVREGLKQLFAITPDITVGAEAANGAALLRWLDVPSDDIILLDMTMPGISGADLISRIEERDGAPPILALSMHDEPQIVQQALANGANGYLTKDNAPRILLEAIRKVADGGRFLDPALAEATAFAFARPNNSARPPHEALSKRERQVLALFASGVGVSEIGNRLFISNKTVSSHKARIMAKLDLSTNADLILYAIKHKLTDYY